MQDYRYWYLCNKDINKIYLASQTMLVFINPFIIYLATQAKDQQSVVKCQGSLSDVRVCPLLARPSVRIYIQTTSPKLLCRCPPFIRNILILTFLTLVHFTSVQWLPKTLFLKLKNLQTPSFEPIMTKWRIRPEGGKITPRKSSQVWAIHTRRASAGSVKMKIRN